MENCIINTTGIDAYNYENQKLAEDFLEQYFFTSFRDNNSSLVKKTLELIISPKCNLGCRYCYIHKHKKQIFDENIFDEDKTLYNLDLILKWLEKNKFNPDFEIFSGELFAQEIGFKVLERIYEYEANIDANLRCKVITVPTNFTFLNSDELTDRIKNLQIRFKELNIQLFLSASFDGACMEQNRPYTKTLDFDINLDRDDNYYNKVFAYCKENDCGLHPMIYSKNIDKWHDNFLWFQEKMKQFNIAWEDLYLLHVRNEEWDDSSINEFQKFIEFLYDWTFKQVGENPDYLINFLLRGHGFNILSTPFTMVGRGLTCGLQSSLCVRLSDLMIYPCHRTGYEHYYCGQFIEDSEEILKYKNKNAELLITVYSIHKNGMPVCSQCPINYLCTGQCLGACHESNNNLFVPIPSVCKIVYTLVATSIKCLLKYNAYTVLLSQIDPEIAEQLEYVKKELDLC